MKKYHSKLLSIILCLCFMAGMIVMPTPITAVAADASAFEGTLGTEWSVGWNGSTVSADEFVKITSSQKKVGAYSLQIGHPQEKTQLTLKLQIPVESVEAYQYALWYKATGAVDSFTIYARDGADGTGYGNILGYDLTGKVTTSWAQAKNADNADDTDTDGSATEITVDSGVFCLDIGVTCAAGTYVYIDNLDVFTTAKPTVQLNRDSSFERFYGTSNVSGYNIDTFVTYSTDKASDGTTSMRIGHPTLDTNVVVKRYIGSITGRTSQYNWFDFDSYIELPEAAEGETLNPADYVTTAKVEMKGYSPSVSTKNLATSDLKTITVSSEDSTMLTGAWHTDTGSTNCAWVGTDSMTFMYVEITVNIKAGTYIYFDNLSAGHCTWNRKTEYPDYMFDGSFEQGIDIRPQSNLYYEEDMPKGWYVSWNSNSKIRYQYLTPNAYEGERALYLTSEDNECKGHTIAQDIKGLTAGDTYVFEAYIKKSGAFSSARIWRNDHNTAEGGNNSNTSIVPNFPNTSYSDWTKISGTFVPTDSDTILSIYFVAPKGSWMALDNIVVYNQADENKVNLIDNGGFEKVVLQPDTSMTSALVGFDNWSVSWNGHEGYRYAYRSNEAHSGDYALAISAREKALSHTIKQIPANIETGVNYTVEGYFKKIGTFSAVSLMETATGGNSTFKQLKNVDMEEYTHVTASFTARANSAFNIYTVSGKDALLLVDDLVLYRTDDETKTNLLKNGGFENWSATPLEQYRLRKTFKTAPQKIEATISLPADFDKTQSAGVIVGNYNGDDASVNLEVTTYGRPRVYIMDANGKQADFVFDNVNLLTGKETKVAVEIADGNVKLYVNDELAGEKALALTVNTAANPYAISGDLITEENRYAYDYLDSNKHTNPNYFKGEIYAVNFYGADGKAIASFDMCDTLNPQVIADATKNGYDALRYGNYITELQAEDDDATAWPYSFVAIGDTQYVCERDKKSGTNDMTKIYDWIIDNAEKKNIKFVMGLGDITDENTVEEYAVAATQLQKLNDAGIPQSIIRGNHDGPNAKVMDLYDECLRDVIEATPYDGIMTAPTFDENGDLLSGTYDNMYYTVEVGEHKWLIFAFGYQPSDEVLAWAGDVIEAHSDYSVILTTHGYINGQLEIGNDARWRLWNNLGSLYENIKLILCGDCTAIDIGVNKRTGVNGNVVTEMVIDRQTIDQAKAYGFVTLLRFSEDGSKVKVEDFAAVQEKYFRPANQMIIDIGGTATANDGAVTNFEDWLDRQDLFDNKSFEMQQLIADEKAKILAAEGAENINAAYEAAKEQITILANETKTVAGGSQVRDSFGTNDIRFVLELDDSFYQYMNGKYENVEFGTIIARGDKYTGPLEYSEKTSGFSSTCATTIKRTSTFKPEEYTTLNSGETTVYTCVIRNIPESCFDVELRARTYLKYTDENGTTRFVYGDEVSTTFATVMQGE